MQTQNSTRNSSEFGWNGGKVVGMLREIAVRILARNLQFLVLFCVVTIQHYVADMLRHKMTSPTPHSTDLIVRMCINGGKKEAR